MNTHLLGKVLRKRTLGSVYKEAMNILKEGCLIKEISKKLNVYRGTVRFWCDETPHLQRLRQK